MSLVNTIDRLSWKTIGFAALSFIAVTGWLIGQTTLAQPTRSTSQATAPTPIITPLLPSAPPIIDSMEYFYAKPGDTVRLRGRYFGSASPNHTLYINTLPITSIGQWTDSFIDFTVPGLASSGPITLTVAGSSTTGPILTIYTNPRTDPQLQLDQIPTGYTLTLHRAPRGSHLDLGALGTFSINADPQILLTTPAPIVVVNATLTDAEGILLPLYIDVLSQSLMH